MLKVALKNLLGRKLRLVTTGLAIILGVAFMAGALVLTDTVGRAFDNLFTNVYAGTDAYVRGAAHFDNQQNTDRASVPSSLVDTVARIPGVKAAEADVSGYAQIVGADGDAVGNPTQGPPALGFNWLEVPELNFLHLVEGRPPKAIDEVVIDRQSAKDGHLAVGARTKVLTKAGAIDVTVVGIAKFGKADSPGGATVAAFAEEAAERYLSEPGRVSGVAVVADDGVSQQQIRDRIAEALPDRSGDVVVRDDRALSCPAQGTALKGCLEVVTGKKLTEENQDDIQQGLSFFKTFLLAFALIALFVGSFIIYNTFSILIAQRLREMALLRAIGASRRQVLSSVLVEALGVGLAASALGLLAGVGVAALLLTIMRAVFEVPTTTLVLTRNTVLVSVVTGTVVAVAAAFFPARRGSRVPPIAAMRDVAIERTGRIRSRVVIGGLILALGVLSLLNGLLGGGGSALAQVGIGALLTILGVAALGPLFARPVTRLLGAPLPRFRGITGTLARENAMRNPRRTSTTAAALMIGVALVSFIAITASSVNASIEHLFDKQFTGDFIVGGKGPLSPSLADELRALPEVGVVSSVRQAAVRLDGKETSLTAMDAVPVTQLADFDIVAGKASDLGTSGIAVLKDKAKDEGWHVGTKLPVVFAETGEHQLTVRMIYDKRTFPFPYFVDVKAFDGNVRNQLDQQVFGSVARGVSFVEARSAIEKVTNRFPNAELRDREEFKHQQAKQINGFVTFIYGLLALAILIALLGIANTLVLSVVERTHELGLLRAVGMTRGQLRSMVRWESVLISLFGTVGGLGVGLFFGWAMSNALHDQGLEVFRVPFTQLLVMALLAAGAGVVAALWPARRAARLDILRAVTTE